MLRWLGGGRVVSADGGVVSWVNPTHPGYRYPEAAGLLLTLTTQEAILSDEGRDRIVEGLCRDAGRSGGISRWGREYAFDTAIVLNALIDHERSGGRLPDPSLPRRLFDFLAEILQARRATRLEAGESTHWSLSYGCHLLKAVRAVSAYHDREGDPRCLALIDQLVGDILPLYTGGRFRINDRSPLTYLHANCYAVEGLLCAERLGVAGAATIVGECADWLAVIQENDGGVRAWHNGAVSFGDRHADATAQAIRIWSCVDHRTFSPQIRRGLGFLSRLQDPTGGLRYRTESEDVNSWATVFAVQAIRWSSAGGDERLII
jgi:hypothetical protein